MKQNSVTIFFLVDKKIEFVPGLNEAPRH